MRDIVRAELLKLGRRPAAWVLLAAAVVLNQVFGYLIPYLAYRTGDAQTVGGNVPPEQVLASTLPDQLVVNSTGGFPVFAGALSLVLGALMFGGEYGWGTVKTMLTQRPGRVTVLGGQFLTLAIALLVAVATMFVLSAASAWGIALAESAPVHWPDITALASGAGAGWLVLLMWASLGGVLGVTLRGVALPIGLGVVWLLGIENLISAMAESVLTALRPLNDVLPGVNAGSLVAAVVPARAIDPPPGVVATVTEPRALITLVGYCLVCAVIATWTYRRRDVL